MSVGPLTTVLLALFVLALFVVGCGSEITVSKTTKKKDAEKTKDDVAVAAGEEIDVKEQDYIYTSIGKRDPFRSLFDDAGSEVIFKSAEDVIHPLQNYDANSLVVTAIVWGISSPTAIVATPDGKTYVVKTGTLVGRNWGKVVKIKRNAIVVLEQKSFGKEAKVSNIIELKLPVKTIKTTESEFEAPGIGEEEESGESGVLDEVNLQSP